MKYRILNPFKSTSIPFGKFYVEGNYVDGSEEVSRNNSTAVIMNDGSEADKINALQKTAFGSESLLTETAEKAYNSVLASAGASYKRDTMDQRIINDVKNRTGRIIDVQGGFVHGTSYEVSKTAWPILNSSMLPTDVDKDGIPDEWEKKQGLNPNDADDAAKTNLHSFYTNIEMYINGIVK